MCVFGVKPDHDQPNFNPIGLISTCWPSAVSSIETTWLHTELQTAGLQNLEDWRECKDLCIRLQTCTDIVDMHQFS